MYLITFHSNFDANLFQKNLKDYGTIKRKPVPRSLSSSCGTCCEFEPNFFFDKSKFEKESFEAIYEIVNNEYVKICEKD